MSFVARAPSAVSTTFTFTTGAAEANLYDGNDATSAADPSGLTASTKAAYDLGSAFQIERCRVITAAVNAWGNTVNFNIEYSDTSLTAGFTLAALIQVTAGLSQATVQTFAPVGAHRYWRISSPSGTGGNAWLGELTFYTQLMDTIAYTETGNAAVFRTTFPVTGTAYAFTGIAAQFAAKLGATTAPYIETENAVAFRSTFPVTGTAYTFAGNAAPLTSKLNSATAAFAMSGNATVTLQTWGVTGAPCLIASVGAPLTRDYINWLAQPFQGAGWINPAAPSSAWTPIALPSTTWTIDPAQTIPPPVSE